MTTSTADAVASSDRFGLRRALSAVSDGGWPSHAAASTPAGHGRRPRPTPAVTTVDQRPANGTGDRLLTASRRWPGIGPGSYARHPPGRGDTALPAMHIGSAPNGEPR